MATWKYPDDYEEMRARWIAENVAIVERERASLVTETYPRMRRLSFRMMRRAQRALAREADAIIRQKQLTQL